MITKQVLLDVEQERIRQMTARRNKQPLDKHVAEKLVLVMAEDFMESKDKEDVYNNLIKIAATTVKMAEVYKRG